MEILQSFPVTVGRTVSHNPLSEIRVTQFSGINAMPGELDRVVKNTLAKDAAMPPVLLLILPFATKHAETHSSSFNHLPTITAICGAPALQPRGLVFPSTPRTDKRYS